MKQLKKIDFIFRLICIASLSVPTSAATDSPEYDLFQTQRSYFKTHRTRSQRMNPFSNPNQFDDSAEVKKFAKGASSADFEYTYDEAKGVLQVQDRKSPSRPPALIPLTTKEELLKYRPSSLEKRMAEKAKSIYRAGKQGLRHTALNLPMEASVFYIALGAVSAMYLVSNSGNNPAALKVFNDQQTSAVGITSLFMFLSTMNATSSIAGLFLKNPKWHVMIPYLSLSVGSMVQSYYSTLVTDPNVKACVNQMFGPIFEAREASPQPCDKAYEFFMLQKFWEFAPGLTTLIVSTVLATGIQFSASAAALKAERKITDRVIKREGLRKAAKTVLLRFSGFINPGAVPFLTVSGVWLYLTKVSNLALFASIDHKIIHGVSFAAKNIQENLSLPLVRTIKKTSGEISDKIFDLKKVKWSDEVILNSCLDKAGNCLDLLKSLEIFKEQSNTWRMANIADIYESHFSWQTYLGDLVSRYLVSKEVYSRFVGEAVKYKKRSREENFLSRKYPLWGIHTKGTLFFDETYYTDPHLPESEQLELALEFKRRVLRHFKEFKERAGKLYGDHLVLERLLSPYFEEEKAEEGQEIESLGKLVQGVGSWINSQEKKGKQRYPFFVKIKSAMNHLGPADPQLQPGLGFLETFSRSPEIHRLYQQIDLSVDNTWNRQRKVRNFTQVLLENMVCGPDTGAGESVIEERWGFKAYFKAPRITDLSTRVKNGNRFCSRRFPRSILPGVSSRPFLGPLRMSPGRQSARYQSGFQYLKHNLIPELYSLDFDSWWKQNTESEMTAAFESFQKSYMAIVGKLHSRLLREDYSVWNYNQVVANGVLQNIQQELRLYLMILGEMLRAQGVTAEASVRAKDLVEWQPSAEGVEASSQIIEVPKEELNLIQLQAVQGLFDLDGLVPLDEKSILKPRFGGNSFGFQLQLQNQFAEFASVFKQIRVKGEGQSVMVESKIENSDFDSLIDDIEASTVQLAKIFGVLDQEAFVGPNQSSSEESQSSDTDALDSGLNKVLKRKLSHQKRKLVVHLLKRIDELAFEVKSYGMIINAVNWKSLNGLKALSEKEAQRDQKVRKLIENVGNPNSVGPGR